jgi:catechol 2,3-dioxygenase
MSIETATSPPFNITRASHVSLSVRDLAASRHFYAEVLGLVVSSEENGALYLRGVEEACHHSLVLTQSNDMPCCDHVGMRVASPADLDAAETWVRKIGGDAERVVRPHQGPSLLVTLDTSTPRIELCASMELKPRMLAEYPFQKGGKALRLNHYQCVVPDVDGSAAHFGALGFRPSKFTKDAQSGAIVSVFLHRKNDPHDIVLARGAGPRLHHFAYVVADLAAMLRAADTAAYFGFGRQVEHGISRHGPPNGVFLYLRDPDGHRIELILPPMQYMDAEEVPNAWDSTQGASLIPWGDGPPQRWREEATPFVGVKNDAAYEGRWLPKI